MLDNSSSSQPDHSTAFSFSCALLALQAGLTSILVYVLRTVGLLDPVSAQTGFRISEEILCILGCLGTATSAKVSLFATLGPRHLTTLVSMIVLGLR